jgi:hypothetical protein
MSTVVNTYAGLVLRMTKDERIHTVHIGLLTALFICWQKQGYSNPFSVSRKQLMTYSKIASVATYHKCIKELSKFGYIRYEPSYHPVKGSQVYWQQVQSNPVLF